MFDWLFVVLLLVVLLLFDFKFISEQATSHIKTNPEGMTILLRQFTGLVLFCPKCLNNSLLSAIVKQVQNNHPEF